MCILVWAKSINMIVIMSFHFKSIETPFQHVVFELSSWIFLDDGYLGSPHRSRMGIHFKTFSASSKCFMLKHGALVSKVSPHDKEKMKQGTTTSISKSKWVNNIYMYLWVKMVFHNKYVLVRVKYTNMILTHHFKSLWTWWMEREWGYNAYHACTFYSILEIFSSP